MRGYFGITDPRWYERLGMMALAKAPLGCHVGEP